MRLPGFLHRKGQPFQCRVVSVDGRPPCKMADFPGDKPLPPELLAALDADAGAGIVREEPSEWQRLNTAALQNLSAWVPALFPKAKFQQGTGAWQVRSKDLGRKLQEDLSISPLGVRDFGAESGMSPVDVVMQYGNKDLGAAADWLRERLGGSGNKEKTEKKEPDIHWHGEHVALRRAMADKGLPARDRSCTALRPVGCLQDVYRARPLRQRDDGRGLCRSQVQATGRRHVRGCRRCQHNSHPTSGARQGQMGQVEKAETSVRVGRQQPAAPH